MLIVCTSWSCALDTVSSLTGCRVGVPHQTSHLSFLGAFGGGRVSGLLGALPRVLSRFAGRLDLEVEVPTSSTRSIVANCGLTASPKISWLESLSIIEHSGSTR